jgi:hypothetical protein
LIASVIVVQPDLSTLDSIGAWLGIALFIGLVAAVAYNQFT